MDKERENLCEAICSLDDETIRTVDNEDGTVTITREQLEALKERKTLIISHIDNFREAFKELIDDECNDLIEVIKKWNTS